MASTYILQARGQGCRYIKIELWHLEICQDNQPAAALLAFLCSYHNSRQTDKARAAEINAQLVKRKKDASWNETDWQFHTDEMLRNGVMLFQTDAIRKGIDYLLTAELIFTEPPAHLKELFNTGRTKWFLVNYAKINKWIIENAGEDLSASEETSLPLAAQHTPNAQNGNKAAGIMAAARKLFRFWQVALGKRRATADEKRLNIIAKRLRDGKSEIDVAQAILGNKNSAWHQGANDKRMVYDDIGLICRDAAKIEWFQDKAEDAGITLDLARLEYEKVITLAPETGNASKADSAPKKSIPTKQGKVLTESGKIRHRFVARTLAPAIATKLHFDKIMNEIMGLLLRDDWFDFVYLEDSLRQAVTKEAMRLEPVHDETIKEIIKAFKELQGE